METNYDRAQELKAFGDTKTGVKGLVDAGIAGVPKIFIQPPDNLNKTTNPKSVLEEMKQGVHRFHEQDSEVRKEWYTRDVKKAVVYNCNFDLFSAPTANWRDTFCCSMAPKPPNPEELPPPCRWLMNERLACEEISNIDHKSSRGRRDINPVTLVKNLEASNVILQQHSEEVVQSVGGADSELRLRACWVVVAQYGEPDGATMFLRWFGLNPSASESNSNKQQPNL
ncbi:1-aminocyclopropane-1-carboxylate oxidase homolog 3-like [Camellia sinensis]|uniref:1-aminocyclopropane-1-carboxylate oxidase homolog 3-like n=1 Tax=Camellia sinensis TaxID=4442 RepID=UPI0010365F8B|nr:1-aminocyclopropane-1-carboxylate oxidase homolog 3-like [Camellia sinensis]